MKLRYKILIPITVIPLLFSFCKDLSSNQLKKTKTLPQRLQHLMKYLINIGMMAPQK